MWAEEVEIDMEAWLGSRGVGRGVEDEGGVKEVVWLVEEREGGADLALQCELLPGPGLLGADVLVELEATGHPLEQPRARVDVPAGQHTGMNTEHGHPRTSHTRPDQTRPD